MNNDRPIKFGTDGWRGIIADDFTYDNVRRVAGAIASYVLKHEDPAHGVIVGYDTRFASQRVARVASEVLVGSGIPVKLAGDYSHPGNLAGGQGFWCSRRRCHHFQPQPMELEWSEVQSEVRRVGHA